MMMTEKERGVKSSKGGAGTSERKSDEQASKWWSLTHCIIDYDNATLD